MAIFSVSLRVEGDFVKVVLCVGEEEPITLAGITSKILQTEEKKSEFYEFVYKAFEEDYKEQFGADLKDHLFLDTSDIKQKEH